MIVILSSCFLLIDWLSFGEEGVVGKGSSKLDVQGQEGRKILDVERQGSGVSKIVQFSWAPYMYCPYVKHRTH